MKSEQSSLKKQYGNKNMYADVLKESVKKGDSQNIDFFQKERGTNKNPRRPITNINLQLFLGYCYSCNNFGHKSFNCKMNKNLEYCCHLYLEF